MKLKKDRDNINNYNTCGYCSHKIFISDVNKITYKFDKILYKLYYCKDENSCIKRKELIIQKMDYYTEDEFSIRLIKQDRLKKKLDTVIKK